MKFLAITLLLLIGVFVGGAILLSLIPMNANQTQITKDIQIETIQ